MKTSIWDRTDRLAGLRRFAVAITVLNILGHFVLGFEQSWAQPLVALATGYGLEILLELIDARLNGRPSRFTGGLRARIDFLLSAHITSLACSMLIYSNSRLGPVVFATAAAIASKAIIRMRINGNVRHVFNPSNIGITITLLLFPWVGVAQPYQFTENLDGLLDWALPVVLIIAGTFLNSRFTKRMPLIVAWLATFILQGVVRSLIFGTPILPTLTPITGVAFLLYTFYMVTDPATTPSSTRGQILFGAGVALAYSALVIFHVVFGLFFALTIVCTIRYAWLLVYGLYARPAAAAAAAAATAVAEPKAKPEVKEMIPQSTVMLAREEA
ncbi:MAG: enediyne biosynthesis protein UnbU [Chlorobi bacterium]|nr:enediyne biosynthesis protein UnbU [Chlorobiota bacterium]